MKTINDAVKMVPPQYRERLLKLWELTNCSDLYDGQLGQYMDVMISRSRHVQEQLNVKQNQLDKIREQVLELTENSR
jgi:hypothetical protein